jgi:hypothetical protein
MKVYYKKYRAPISIVVTGLIIATALIFFEAEIKSLITIIKSERTHPSLVIAAYLVLPMLFFPISALMVLLGIRLGALVGCMVMIALMPVHLLVSF